MINLIKIRCLLYFFFWWYTKI